MFEYLKMGWGLVTENDPNTENCNLFLAQYHLLKNVKEGLVQEDRTFFLQNMLLKNNKLGLYNRRSVETTPPRSVSHDEILGWMVSSSLFDTNHKNEIWDHLVWHLGSYNNTGNLMDYLPFNPGNFYVWGQLCGSWLSYLFLPIFVVNMLIAINKAPNDTSGKIMYWMSFDAMKKTWINGILQSIFENKMIKQYGSEYVSALLHAYHNAENKQDFPIFKEL